MAKATRPSSRRDFDRPRSRIRERIGETPGADAEHFPTPQLKAVFFAAVAEAPSCWPRVLKGTMTSERFHERQERMRQAILKATT
jgi:hypothetical protein